jgi:hypothetical protein
MPRQDASQAHFVLNIGFLDRSALIPFFVSSRMLSYRGEEPQVFKGGKE